MWEGGQLFSGGHCLAGYGPILNMPFWVLTSGGHCWWWTLSIHVSLSLSKSLLKGGKLSGGHSFVGNRIVLYKCLSNSHVKGGQLTCRGQCLPVRSITCMCLSKSCRGGIVDWWITLFAGDRPVPYMSFQVIFIMVTVDLWRTTLVMDPSRTHLPKPYGKGVLWSHIWRGTVWEVENIVLSMMDYSHTCEFLSHVGRGQLTGGDIVWPVTVNIGALRQFSY